MELLPLHRKNQNYREVRDEDGNVWRVNRHGVVYRKEPDPHFEGWEVTVWPEYSGPIVKVARTDTTFKRCRCC